MEARSQGWGGGRSPIHSALKVEYLGIDLTNKVQDPYNENFKTLEK